MATLTPGEAKRFYDRFGARQDQQDFYEAPAVRLLLNSGDFGHAEAVFELGCGTGRLAQTLLLEHLPPASTYQAIDVSTTMVALSQEKLSMFADRATVSLDSGSGALPVASSSVDRFLATYVFDLLPDDEIYRVLEEAHRILKPDGLLCIAGITSGTTILSRLVMSLWRGVSMLSPSLVGGCRPTNIKEFATPGQWQIKEHRVVIAYGIASEVFIASPVQ